MGRDIATPAPARDFPSLLEARKGEIARVLPEGIDIERVVRMALNAYHTTPSIRDCTPLSILISVMKAAELGLEPAGGMKHAWLIPYKKECTLQVSYTGMLELARRSGLFRAIEARDVGEHDEFSLHFDPRPVLFHRPNILGRGVEIGAYAYAILESGEMVLEWGNRAEIEKIRASGRAGNVWEQWWGQMACKSMLKRLLKRQPQSVELRKAIEHDDEEYTSAVSPAVPATRPEGTRSAALAARLAPPVEPAEPEAAAEEMTDEQAAAEYGGGANDAI